MKDKTNKDFFLRAKYFLDITFSTLIIIIISPILATIALAIKLDSQGPALFKQQRIGLRGRPFHVYKFRTMVVNAEKMGLGYNIEKNDSRITKVGNFLRAWSLDELPQIINILKGEMSFIGPRPTLKYQVDAYTSHQRRRLLMKPGITGWAQVNGRNNIPWEERIELDIWYVDNWTPWLDIRIFFRTFFVIFKKDSVYNEKGISYDFHGEANKNFEKQ